MTDILDANGLTIKTYEELLADLALGLQQIYGSDINIGSNSPDGQLINIMAQLGTDQRELLAEVYNSMNPDTAVGRVLDQRCAYNNIERNNGSYTIQPVEITVNQDVTLQGLDADLDDPNGTGYTVADDAGNQFILTETATISAGTTELNFRAAEIGRIETVADTITNAITVIWGVTNIDNPNGFTTLGTNEETDPALRLRRERSVANASVAFEDGLLGMLYAVDNVTEAIVYQNRSPITDIYGIPRNSIWVIADGGTDEDIAETIYSKITPGVGMKGDEAINVTASNGIIHTIKFDRSAAKNLYIEFDIQPVIVGTLFDTVNIKAYIANNLVYNIGDYAETSFVTEIAKQAILEYNGEAGVPINVQVSIDGVIWDDFLSVDSLNEKWNVSTDRIDIEVL